MKNILLTEGQLRQIIREAALDTFSFDTLKSIRSLKGRYNYCKEQLGFTIGRGSSRVCFQLDDGKILKLALNKAGLAQNEKEGQKDWYLESFNVTPTVYHDLSDMDNFTYIVSEYVLPAKKEDFPECLGITYQEFVKFLRTCMSQYWNAPFIQHNIYDNDTFSEMLENNEDLNCFNGFLCDYQVRNLDITRVANLGMVQRDGEPHIVILDNGVDEEILRKFYE